MSGCSLWTLAQSTLRLRPFTPLKTSLVMVTKGLSCLWTFFVMFGSIGHLDFLATRAVLDSMQQFPLGLLAPWPLYIPISLQTPLTLLTFNQCKSPGIVFHSPLSQPALMCASLLSQDLDFKTYHFGTNLSPEFQNYLYPSFGQTHENPKGTSNSTGSKIEF